MKYFIKVTLLFVLLLATHGRSDADARYSYLYIQGDKVTPFYVKLNGVMQPRFGKNYCIIPKLLAGSVTIEILFQQNQFPAETFSLNIPENSSQGFLLDRQDNTYLLYDLATKQYIHPDKK